MKARVLAGAGLGYALISQAAREDAEASVSDLNRYSGIIRFRDIETLALGFWRHEGALGAAWVDDKFLTSSTLRNLGLPAPRSVCITTAAELNGAISVVGFPAVIKPRNGARGEGVTVEIDNFRDLELAFRTASQVSASVLVEEHIYISEELRILASNEHCFGVIRRTLPKVLGDGSHTISQLIDLKNIERSTNPAVHNKLIPKDNIVEATLKAKGYTLSDTPDRGTQVIVRNVGGLSSGGDSEDFTEQTTEHVRRLSIEVIRAIPGLYWAGIDVAIERDTGQPWIIEANINAGYSLEYPSAGERRQITPALWQARKADAFARAQIADEFEAQFSSNPKNSENEHSIYFGTNEQRLSFLYRIYLERHGYEVVQISPSIFEAYLKSSLVLRYTRSLRTSDDLAIVNRFLKSHYLIRKILQVKNIPRPRAVFLSENQDIESHIGDLGSRVKIIPARAPWDSSRSKIVTKQAPSFKRRTGSKHYLQAVVEGARFRVIAGRRRAFAIATKEDDVEEILDHNLSHLAEIAVTAVCAVPELRWAAVDMVVRDNPTRNRILVEGLTVDPVFNSDYSIVDGSIESFFQWFTEYTVFSNSYPEG